MRLVSVTLLVAGFVAVGISACTAEHVDAIDETSQGVEGTQTPADPNDPFGSCEVVAFEDYDDFVCSLDGSPCLASGGYGLGSDGESWFADVQSYCRHECVADSDCPVPTTGHAMPYCPLRGAPKAVCELRCDETTTCPDGFVCALDHNLIPDAAGSLLETERFLCIQHLVVDPFRPEWLE